MAEPPAERRKTTRKVLLQTLQKLRNDEFDLFKWHLTDSLGDFASIPISKLENLDRKGTVDLMVNTYCIYTVKVTKMILVEIGMNNLVLDLPQTDPEGTWHAPIAGRFVPSGASLLMGGEEELPGSLTEHVAPLCSTMKFIYATMLFCTHHFQALTIWHKMCYEKTQRTYVPPTSLIS
ncbi:unnamed protein product [Menidia menidia]|uniref:(Atlantic silverside) hypothetical protein n=1 Tax=Menidia menidia TaxID=238744 RepID=A0A8S4BET6_9TELE|nr:unnamed protein product [Menidia menidia]